MTLGSLFDGAGTCPFAAQICGITPAWASEIEPFPIAVTKKRFPDMEHLGDITRINGAEIAPVDIITFGSPCQDLSVAGKRAGLDGERSGLFMEAVRIIKEMRAKTNGEYPSIAVWENVPGAFSSNKGEDFRVVLEELCKVKNGKAAIPRPPRGKWSDAGEIVGDGYSLAWRVLDAQFWGVPQRRRRVFLVADFAGGCAGKILFEREGLSRDFAESRKTWERNSRSLAFGTGDKNTVTREYGISSYASNAMKSDNPHSGIYEADTSRTLDGNGGIPSCNQGGMAVVALEGNGARPPHKGCGYSEEGVSYTLNAVEQHAVAFACNQRNEVRDLGDRSGALQAQPGMKQQTFVAAFMGGQGARAHGIGYCGDGTTPTLKSALSGGNTVPDIVIYDARGNGDGVISPTITGDHNGHMSDYTAVVCYAVDMGGGKSQSGVTENLSPTLACTHGGEPAVCFVLQPVDIILRRLTPTECARLQGMPDWWCDDIDIQEPTDEDVAFWREVFETYRLATAPNKKPKTDNQIKKFLKAPYSDSAAYKMWGNGMALPNVLYIMEGIKKVLKEK